jgi:hypothetical protein
VFYCLNDSHIAKRWFQFNTAKAFVVLSCYIVVLHLFDSCSLSSRYETAYLLQPTPLHLTVKEYVSPEKFAYWKEYGESIGFRYVASGPLVSSLITIYVGGYRCQHLCSYTNNRWEDRLIVSVRICKCSPVQIHLCSLKSCWV